MNGDKMTKIMSKSNPKVRKFDQKWDKRWSKCEQEETKTRAKFR